MMCRQPAVWDGLLEAISWSVMLKLSRMRFSFSCALPRGPLFRGCRDNDDQTKVYTSMGICHTDRACSVTILQVHTICNEFAVRND